MHRKNPFDRLLIAQVDGENWDHRDRRSRFQSVSGAGDLVMPVSPVFGFNPLGLVILSSHATARAREEQLICTLLPQFNRAGKVWPKLIL